MIHFRYPEFLYPAFFDDEKYVVIKAGRRSGKTYNAAQWICDELLSPDNEWDFNPQGIWVDTTQGNISKYLDRYFKKILEPIWAYCHWNEQKKILKLPNGIPIDFGSAERPELLEGFEYQRGVLNESGIILKKAALWDNTLKPMFKGKKTKVRLIGTPKGKNKFHELSLMYKSYQFTCYDSPYWDKEELERERSQTPERVWRQEYLAEVVDGEGSVFRNIRNCIRDQTLPKGLPGGTYVIGIDLAKHQDFTVIIVVDVNTRQVVYIDRFNTIDWSFQKQKILNVWDLFNRGRVVVDATGAGNPIYDDLANAGVSVEPFIFTSASKKELVWDLAVGIDNQSIFYPNNQDLIGELESFEYQMSRSGNIQYSAPEGLHDDMVIALALAYRLIKSSVVVNLSFI